MKFGKIFGAVKDIAPLLGPAEAVVNVVDRFVETPEEKDALRQLKLKILQNSDVAQAEINKVEAQSTSLLKSGWRPLTGWFLSIAVGIYYIPKFALASYLWTRAVIRANELLPYPVSIEDSGLLQLLLAMLGLSSIRTFEKVSGKEK